MAIKRALDIAEGRAARELSLFRTDRLEPLQEALNVLQFARMEAAKKAPGLQHPLLCLDAIQHGVEYGGLAGLRKEGECFQMAASLDTHKALVHVFFATRSTKKVKGVTDVGLKAKKMACVAVIGGGLMGSGIATALAMNGLDVVLKEVSQQFLDGGMSRIKSNLDSRVKKGAMTKQARPY